MDGELTVIERTFQTPAGHLSDRTTIPPAGLDFGVSPNPFKTEHLVKERADLAALEHLLPRTNTDFGHLHRAQKEVGDRGVILVTINSPLDYHAGNARDMQDLMVDYYDDRDIFDDLFDIFHRRSLEQVRTAFEGGAEFIFGTWFFNSLSSGWSPAIFEEVFVPQIRDQVELTHEYGRYYDYYDDGNPGDYRHRSNRNTRRPCGTPWKSPSPAADSLSAVRTAFAREHPEKTSPPTFEPA
jgi:hypothetical protein